MTIERNYFAAANTVNGFVSYYGDIFDKCDRVYIIKGGSGTGKSRFMREVADYAVKELGCCQLERFYCSFDPDSLDGIIINNRVAVVDGTAPHVYEPTLPGAKENLLDFGTFWDSSRLLNERDELSSLLRQKKRCFERSYKYLSSYGALCEMKNSLIMPFVDREKMCADASKRVSELESEKEGMRKTRPTKAFGRKGITDLSATGIKRICMKDAIGVGYLWLEEIIRQAEKYRLPIDVSYHPLFAYRPSSVTIAEQIEFSVDFADGDGIDINDFIKSGGVVHDIRNEKINLARSELLNLAQNELINASNIHFNVEKIYMSAMDFEKKEKFTVEFLSALEI